MLADSSDIVCFASDLWCCSDIWMDSFKIGKHNMNPFIEGLLMVAECSTGSARIVTMREAGKHMFTAKIG